jgi:hypothetical protein
MLLGRELSAQSPSYSACYVPSVGAVYLIKLAGLPNACLAPSHVEFSWSGDHAAYGPQAGGGIVLSPTNQFSLLRSCAAGQILKWSVANSSWACADDLAGAAGGDITEVVAGTGLTGGGPAGSVTVSANLAPAGADNGVATNVARGDHRHDARYYTSTELNQAGTINAVGNPVDWSRLKNVPAGIADGVDALNSGDIESVTASIGLSGGGTSGDLTLSVTPTYRLPQDCSAGQNALWNGSSWLCGKGIVAAGTKQLDMPAVAAGDCFSDVLAIDAEAGDVIDLYPSLILPGLIVYTQRVMQSGDVLYVVCNTRRILLDPPPQLWAYVVMRP